MSSLPARRTARRIKYPTSDGKPMAETELHRNLMFDLIHSLTAFYADQLRVHVTGNLLLYYVEGNKRKHVSPDVFVAFGVEKRLREYYLLWEEGHPPRFVIELTSSSTRKEDQVKKLNLYRDVLKVREYFHFDPNEDYLDPSMQGWRLRGGVYQPIAFVEGRLPSATTGLHLERAGRILRLWNPETQAWLPTQQEALESATLGQQEAQLAQQEAQLAQQEAQLAQQEAQLAQQEAERRFAEAQREIERLRQRLGLDPSGEDSR